MEVNLKINDKEVTAVVDTGADCSSISEAFASQLKAPRHPHTPPLLSYGISGHREELTEWVALDLVFGSVVTRQSLNIHPNPPVPLILGRDFLNKHNVEINRKERELWIDEACIPLRPPSSKTLSAFASLDTASTSSVPGPVQTDPDESANKMVSVYSPVTILPQHEAVVQLKFTSDPLQDVTFCMEGTPFAEQLGLRVAGTIMHSSQKDFYTRVYNPSSGNLFIPADFPLCYVSTASVIDDADISTGSYFTPDSYPSPSPFDCTNDIRMLFNDDFDEFDMENDPTAFAESDLTDHKSPLGAKGSPDSSHPTHEVPIQVFEPADTSFPAESFLELIKDALPKSLPLHERKKLFERLYCFHDVFSRHKDDLGKTDVMQHRIIVEPNTRPIAIPPHRSSVKERKTHG